MKRQTSVRRWVLTVAAALAVVTPASAAQAVPPPITECTAQWTTLAEWDEGYVMLVALTHDEPSTYWWSYFSLPEGHELVAHWNAEVFRTTQSSNQHRANSMSHNADVSTGDVSYGIVVKRPASSDLLPFSFGCTIP